MSSPTDGSAGPSTYASNVVPAPVPAPVAAPSTKPGPNPRSRMALLNKKHSQPLPITLPSLPKGSSASPPSSSSTYSTSSSTSILSSFVPSFLARTASRGIELPTCIGTYDAPTRSVWVTDSRSKEILFNSGFFGKGTLSRSEPSWRQRRVDFLKGGECECAVHLDSQDCTKLRQGACCAILHRGNGSIHRFLPVCIWCRRDPRGVCFEAADGVQCVDEGGQADVRDMLQRQRLNVSSSHPLTRLSALMAEQIREKRRIERKQFKIDRAAAMLDAAKTAEAVLVSGLTAATPTAVASSSGGGSPATGLQRQLSGLEGEGEADRDAFADGYGENETATSTPIPVEEDGAVSSIPPSPAPSASSNAVLDYTSLTPQTFLVRPTRPDANRNRGRKAFKRRPPPQKPQSQPQPGSQPSQPPSTMNPDVAGPAVPSVDTAGPGTASSSSLPSAGPSAGRSDATGIDVTIPPTMSQEPHNENDEEEDEVLARGEEIEEMVEEMEHLQLGAEEAWFLAAGLGVLKVYDPATVSDE
jgi:hypothetical protein